MNEVYADLAVEMELCSAFLDPDGIAVLDPDGIAIEWLAGWVDVTSDLRAQVPITYKSGNPGNNISDRVADEGVITAAMDNSENNSAGLAGYYSPGHANARATFDQGVMTRVVATYDGGTYYQQQGEIATILPSSGVAGERITMIEALDYMHHLYDDDFTDVNVQVNKRDDELLTTLIASASRLPEETDFDLGSDEYAYAFHDEVNGTSRIVSVIQKMMMSGLGKTFVRGGTTSAEVLTYINRANLLSPGTAVAALSDNMTGLEVIWDENSLVKKVNVITYPVEIDQTDVELWQLNAEIALDPGTSRTFTMGLRDPNGRAKNVAAYSLVPPVIDTDFKFSSVSGSGNDLNADLGIAYSDGTSSIDVTVTNNAASTGYLWFFKPRGKGIYLYEPVSTSKLTGQVAGKTVTIKMVYQEDAGVGRDIVAIVASWFATPQPNVKGVRFIANTSDALMVAGLTVEKGDYVTIAETQTGTNRGFIVNGIDKTFTAEGILYVTWYLCNVEPLDAFILDVDALDTAVLGV